jgi:hypothetical protein
VENSTCCAAHTHYNLPYKPPVPSRRAALVHSTPSLFPHASDKMGIFIALAAAASLAAGASAQVRRFSCRPHTSCGHPVQLHTSAHGAYQQAPDCINLLVFWEGLQVTTLVNFVLYRCLVSKVLIRCSQIALDGIAPIVELPCCPCATEHMRQSQHSETGLLSCSVCLW